MAAGCDQGVVHDQDVTGPPIHLVDANIGASKSLAVDDSIELSFDRYLNPLTVTRQSFALRDAFNQAPVNQTVSYDPVRRVVTLSNPSPGKPWLIEGQPYKVIVPAPASPDDLALRSIDGAGLTANVVIGFFAAAARGKAPDPPMSFCRDVFPILRSCRGCHGAPNEGEAVSAWAGLILETEGGIEATAKNRVSHATNTGARSVGAPPGVLFGVDMPLIDPGNPGNSFLLYKLIRRPAGPNEQRAPATKCTAATVPTWDVASSPIDAELESLSTVIPGRAMPLSGEALSAQELDRLRLWIEQGAPIEACTPCPLDP
jgi:hypothetical protein